MKQRFKALQHSWLGLTRRERGLVVLGSSVLIITLLVWGIFMPLQQRITVAQSRLQAEQQLLEWTQKKADRIASLRANGGASVRTKQALIPTLSSSAQRYQVNLLRMQPNGERVQVWLEPLAFDQLLRWTEHLQDEFGIHVEQLDMVRTEQEGVVEVKRLQLARE